MRGKKYLVASIVIGTTLVCSGCGNSFPELTQEQYNQTIEYAAGILMKHSNNEMERLVYVDPEQVKEERERKAERDAIREANLKELLEKQNAAMEEESRLDQEAMEEENRDDEESANESSLDNSATMEDESTRGSSEDSGDQVASDVGNTKDASDSDSEDDSDSEGGKSSKDSGYSSDAITVTSEDSQELQSNIFISYDGYSVSSHYPESSKSYVINADKGKKLLVLRFDLYNAASSAQEVNMYSKGLTFKVTVNGKNLGYTAVTVLPNDLSSYLGTVDAKAHESLVILTQISEDEAINIKTIELTATMNGKEQTVNLK